MHSSGAALDAKLDSLGHDDEVVENVHKRMRSVSRARGASRASDGGRDGAEGDAMEEDDEERVPAAKRTRSASHAPSRSRSQSGLRDEVHLAKAVKLAKVTQRRAHLMARAGEGDRVILNAMPKHLFAGKRKMGTNDRR